MSDYMEILRMKAKGFSARSISSSLQTNMRTVLDCINRAESTGITFPFAGGRFLHLALCMSFGAVHLATDGGAVTRGTVHVANCLNNTRFQTHR